MILVLDFGGQYAHLIAKRIRHLGVFAEICSPASQLSKFKNVSGIILSGGPSSVFAPDVPKFNSEILELDIPILGLCYGHQLIATHFGGTVSHTGEGEFGKTLLNITQDSPLWKDVPTTHQSWMSHHDSVSEPPAHFEVIARTEHGTIAAMQYCKRSIYTLQFHPEVHDSPYGSAVLQNFLDQCHSLQKWSMQSFMTDTLQRIKQEVGGRNVLMFLSGGVDSSIAFALLNQALGTERVMGLFIDNGFLRKYESETIMERYQQIGYKNVRLYDASSLFLDAISGKVDPQEKRKEVGKTFIEVRTRFLQELELNPDEWMLGQGTLYPDIIESGGSEHANVIKSHHNRVEEVFELMKAGGVVEPLKDLYKDEARKVGELLGLPDSIVWRHPFPGPGLSINVLCSNGDSDETKVTSMPMLSQKLGEAVDSTPDATYNIDTLAVRSVGVQGDQRTYTIPAVIWRKTPFDKTQATFPTVPKSSLDWAELEKTSIQITNSVREVNRVVALLAPAQLPQLKLRSAYCDAARLRLLQEGDYLSTQALEKHNLMRDIFQLLVILLPLSTDGTKDCLVLRPVCSEDVMTAQFAQLEQEVLLPLTRRLYSLEGCDAVFYDITHKPPATFGWE